MHKNSKPGLFLFDLFYSDYYDQIHMCLDKVRKLGFYFNNVKCVEGQISLIVVYGKVVLGAGLVPIDKKEWDGLNSYLDEDILYYMSFADTYDALNLNNDYMDDQVKWRQMEGLDPISNEEVINL